MPLSALFALLNLFRRLRRGVQLAYLWHLSALVALLNLFRRLRRGVQFAYLWHALEYLLQLRERNKLVSNILVFILTQIFSIRGTLAMLRQLRMT